MANAVADLYIILYDAIVAGGSSAPAHGREGYYFGENGHYLTYDLCKAVAVELAARGIGHDTPTAFTEEEYKKVSASHDETGGGRVVNPY